MSKERRWVSVTSSKDDNPLRAVQFKVWVLLGLPPVEGAEKVRICLSDSSTLDVEGDLWDSLPTAEQVRITSYVDGFIDGYEEGWSRGYGTYCPSLGGY
jgi:hypothetical protein